MGFGRDKRRRKQMSHYRRRLVKYYQAKKKYNLAVHAEFRKPVPWYVDRTVTHRRASIAFHYTKAMNRAVMQSQLVGRVLPRILPRIFHPPETPLPNTALYQRDLQSMDMIPYRPGSWESSIYSKSYPQPRWEPSQKEGIYQSHNEWFERWYDTRTRRFYVVPRPLLPFGTGILHQNMPAAKDLPFWTKPLLTAFQHALRATQIRPFFPDRPQDQKQFKTLCSMLPHVQKTPIWQTLPRETQAYLIQTCQHHLRLRKHRGTSSRRKYYRNYYPRLSKRFPYYRPRSKRYRFY